MFEYQIDREAAFLPDFDQRERVGYLTEFQGLGLGEPLEQDLELFSNIDLQDRRYGPVRFNNVTKIVRCAAVIESFSFAGGVGDPIGINAYVSAANANRLRSALASEPASTKITSLGWWIVNFDAQKDRWYEEAYSREPATLSARVRNSGSVPQIRVSSEPTRISRNVEAAVYEVYVEVIPAANATFTLHFATDPDTAVIRNWGLKIGIGAATS